MEQTGEENIIANGFGRTPVQFGWQEAKVPEHVNVSSVPASAIATGNRSFFKRSYAAGRREP